MAAGEAPREPRVLNINVGILGHVDSGKTSLARALSTLLSTAALDKHPQSAERGITLDLGFSAFQVDVPETHAAGGGGWDKLQFTLVDCPGHASLIRTIIGGAQIIDVMILVVDVTKGFQTQTAECLIVGEISPTKHMVVVLNKSDLLPEASREAQVSKMARRVAATMKGTKFEGAPIVPTSVVAGKPAEGVQELVEKLMRCTESFSRRPPCPGDPFLFAVDHCFPIKGQGTVLTGTVLQGSVSVNDTVEIAALKLQKKVKSMQMFHRPVASASQGDRVGLCVVQLDAKLMERGLVATPGSVTLVTSIVASVERIRFHKSKVASKAKYHITVGHTTVMGEAIFFRLPPGARTTDSVNGAHHSETFDFSREYLYTEELFDEREGDSKEQECRESFGGQNGESGQDPTSRGPYWALLTFEAPLVCPSNALYIGSRLDFDIHSPTCRLAFHGRVLHPIEPGPGPTVIKAYKLKRREGQVERLVDSYSLIGKGLFKKETDISQFVGLKVVGPSSMEGTIQSSFGKSGKFKVVYKEKLPADIVGDKALVLSFKRYIFDKSKKLVQ